MPYPSNDELLLWEYGVIIEDDEFDLFERIIKTGLLLYLNKKYWNKAKDLGLI